MLVGHISSDNYVICTYAAITIDRVLFIKKENQLLYVRLSFVPSSSQIDLYVTWDRFSQADIHDLAPELLNTLLVKIASPGTAEKVAENDHLMKCLRFPLHQVNLSETYSAGAMRIIVTARQSLTPGYEQTLAKMVDILGVVSKNPSNPKFDQYIFESISGLMRHVDLLNTPTSN